MGTTADGRQIVCYAGHDTLGCWGYVLFCGEHIVRETEHLYRSEDAAYRNAKRIVAVILAAAADEMQARARRKAARILHS